jgi:DNA (cytosine-5)-methyltransferase 1
MEAYNRMLRNTKNDEKTPEQPKDDPVEPHDDNEKQQDDAAKLLPIEPVTKELPMEPKTEPEVADKSLKTCGSIFSGIGGWEYGAKQVGLKPVFAFEFHQKYADAYKKSHGDHVTVGDVQQTKGSLGEATVDVLFSSPPCQNYSVAKQNKGVENPDARKDVGLVTVEIAKKTNAKVILIENVVAYLTSPVLNTIKNELRENYHIHAGIVNAHEFNCPTSRKRMIATFVRRDLYDSPFIPRPTNSKKEPRGWYEAVKDLIPTLEPGKIYKWQQDRLNQWDLKTLSFPLQISGNNASSTAFKSGRKVRVFRQAHEPSFTIVKSWRAMQMTEILFEDGTVLQANPHCFARWQSFPDEIFANLPEDNQTSTEMIGNAVPPQLCVEILKQLIGK